MGLTLQNTMSHLHWTIQSHNTSIEIIFLFQSFLVPTVGRQFSLFMGYHVSTIELIREGYGLFNIIM